MSAPGKKSPGALDIDDLVRLLRASGSRHASADQVRDDVALGAPTNADGTINLMHYTAWLARQVTAQELHRGN